MADNSAIEWTDATWNPVRGCSRVSPGCGGPNHQGGCYAERIAARFSDEGQPFHGFAERDAHGGRWTGKLALIESQLDLPLRWRRPRRIFVNSMSDLFHEKLPDEAIDQVMAVIARFGMDWHTAQVLTKRAERMRRYMTDPETPRRIWTLIADDQVPDAPSYPNAPVPADVRDEFIRTAPWPLPALWLGVSAEDQERWDERLEHLAATPAAVRFVSIEPMLGYIDVGNAFDAPTENSPYGDIHWVICGGESGPGARPMHPEWPRGLRDQCAAAGVPFFFKQWGEWAPSNDLNVETVWQREQATVLPDGRVREWQPGFPTERLTHDRMRGMTRLGKKAAGRLLDGREHNEFPHG